MADGTHIQWTDATWAPITGCSVVSPGCTNCYAMKLAGTRLAHHPSRAGLTRNSKAGPVWTGEVRFNEEWLTQPLKWKRPRKIFVCAHGDLFHESVPDEWIDRVFAVMALAPQHTFQVLTKRARRMHIYLNDPRTKARIGEIVFVNLMRWNGLKPPLRAEDWRHDARRPWPLPNAWLGVSAEDQARAEERVPWLLDTPAAVRWLSAEPLLGPIDFDKFCPSGGPLRGDPFPLTGRMIYAAARGFDDSINACAGYTGKLNWIVVGGESGPGARPMHPDWARSIRDQCEAAGVAFFFKQWGEWAVDRLRPGVDLGGDMRADRVRHVCRDRENDGHFRKGDRHMRRVGKALAGRLLDGREHKDMPGGTG